MRLEAVAGKGSAAPTSSFDVTDREIVQTRIFDAPRDLVWEVFTNPKHADQWWGPNGFRNTTRLHELKVGGIWKYMMHGGNGTDYPNKVTYKEIVPRERLSYEHGDWEKKHFDVTITFENLGGKTRITMRSLFPTKEALEAVKRFGAVEGGRQTLARLAGYVENMPNAAGDVVVTRLLAAPRQLVWDAWTKKDMLTKWWGPKSLTTPIVELDFKKGGAYRMVMQGPGGEQYPFHGKFLEIAPIDRIVFDAVIEHLEGPLVMTTVTFVEESGKTRLTVRQSRPADKLAAEGQVQGWSESLEKLDRMLGSTGPF